MISQHRKVGNCMAKQSKAHSPLLRCVSMDQLVAYIESSSIALPHPAVREGGTSPRTKKSLCGLAAPELLPRWAEIYARAVWTAIRGHRLVRQLGGERIPPSIDLWADPPAASQMSRGDVGCSDGVPNGHIRRQRRRLLWATIRRSLWPQACSL